MTTESTYVYAISDGTHIKIGVSTRPKNRLKTLSTGNAKKLILIGYVLGSYAIEKDLHRRFRKVRNNGEWMYATDELIEYLNLTFKDRHIIKNDKEELLVYNKIPNV